jgi:histidinol dehydrogenase
MMPLKHLKGPANKAISNGTSVDVAGTVKKVLDDIKANGDQAVGKYSAQFDHWSPASFKLSQDQIDAAIAAVPSQTIDDIKTAQQNIRKFAVAQRDSLRDFELEIEPGVFLGQKNTPINRVGA